MMAPNYYTFTGGEVVPWHVTHVLIADALKFVRARSFEYHENIQEVICHDGVEKIEQFAFYRCPSLRRVIMPGVKEVEERAFTQCTALTCIECGKLERILTEAFQFCISLNSIDLPSAKIVGRDAFTVCKSLINANFGKDLESIRENAFFYCLSLKCITLPLKDGMISITTDNTFAWCNKLNQVDLVGGVYETVAALLLEEWKDDMNDEIGTFSRILSNTPAGDGLVLGGRGGKADVIREWITSVLRKITHYKAEHRRHLNVAAATLQPALPNHIVHKNILPFLELPPHTFEKEDD